MNFVRFISVQIKFVNTRPSRSKMRAVFRNWKEFLIYHCGKCRDYSSKREGQMLKKIIMKGEKNRKKKNYIPPPSYLHQYAHSTLCTNDSRRKNVLNKVFMDHISELMTTGAYATEVYDHGIHVTQTKVTYNYHLLYVYWIHTKTINESQVNDLLTKVAVYLRQELTSARVIGLVPEVRFVKDEEFVKIQFTEEILDKLKSVCSENVTDQSVPEQKNVQSIELDMKAPSMEYSVFGLQYLQIMNNIQNEMKKCALTPIVEVTTKFNTHPKENIQKFNKKELARNIFSKRYESKKLKRASRRALESELLSTEFADSGSSEEFEDWPVEDEENEDNHRST